MQLFSMEQNDQGLKEFRIKLMPELYVAPQLEKIARMEKAIEEGILPERPAGCTEKLRGLQVL